MYHLLLGKSNNSILHFLEKILIYWYSKKQAFVEIVTFGFDVLLSIKLSNKSLIYALHNIT